ncbi:DUF6436 domain-containing protein [Ningiella sp. W23]|uniref:DUF6436 domain-containing protein n=1 Tax=Ningiella sp. W23 TaxID=3023715 RepID=UPI003757CF70
MKLWQKRVLTLSVVMWFILASAGVFAVSNVTSKYFDHDARLSMALMSLDFESRLVNALTDPADSNGARIYHIRGVHSCFCEGLVQAHVKALNALAADKLSVMNVQLEPSSALASMVPSTPAVAVVDEDGDLAYFGPYSQGMGCFSRSGSINTLIQNVADGLHSYQKVQNKTASIQAEASGCYCNQ